AASNYDFGLFIFAPDDVTVSRGKRTVSTRDNVLFELGLFLGELEPERAIGLVQKSKLKRNKVKIPSDLLGVIMPEFPAPSCKAKYKVKPEEAKALVKETAEKIRATSQEKGPNTKMDLLRSYGYRDKEKAFGMTLHVDKISRYIGKLQSKQLMLVARKAYP